MVKSGPSSLISVPSMALAREQSDQLVMSILNRQERLEQVQGQFMRFQVAMNTFNLSRTHRLTLAQKRLEGQIVAGKAALAALEHNLERESGRVNDLEVTVTAAEAELAKVKTELASMELTIQKQNELLTRQGSEIKKLSLSTKQRQALAEAVMLLASIATIRSSFVTSPISTVLMVMPRKSKVTYATKSILRFALFLVLLRKMRAYAMATGWINESISLKEVAFDVLFPDSTLG